MSFNRAQFLIEVLGADAARDLAAAADDLERFERDAEHVLEFGRVNHGVNSGRGVRGKVGVA